MVKPKQQRSGKYMARHYIGRSRYESLGTFDTEEEAVKAQEKALILVEAGIDPFKRSDSEPAAVVSPGSIRFDRFAEELLFSRRHMMSRGTFENYESKLRVHIVPTFGKKRLKDITPAMVTRWFNGLPQTATRRQMYVVLNMIMRRAVKAGEIEKNPCMVEGTSKIKSPKKGVQHWADLRFLVEMTSDPQMKAMLWGLAGTGMRIGELLALDWEDLDLDGGSALVDEHLTRFGLQPGYKAHEERERTVVVFPEAVRAFRALQASRGGIQLGPIFLHSRGGRMGYSTAYRLFVDLRASVALDAVGFHHLRALHASTFAKASTVEQLQQQLGHDDLRSTLRYVNSDAESRKAVVAALEGQY